jgi:acyl-CoA thioesterase-1
MSVRKLALVIAILSLGPVACAVGAHAAGSATCMADIDLAGTVSALPRAAAALKSGTLRVLAVGSATMFGPDASLQAGTVTSQALARSPGIASVPPAQTLDTATQAAFPFKMAAALKELVPGLQMDVVLRGGRGLSAADMLALLRTELKNGPYQLVLWQTGTVEAVRNSPPGEFAQVLSEGAEAVEGAGADLVLIDPQYSRFLQTNSNLDPYDQALQQTAALPGVMLFHRFELMRAWASDGVIDLERTPRPDRRKTVELLHACLGTHLARLVLAGTRF